ncbi:MAG TPA: hypothetical protein VFI11_05625 [Anaerolineales bacterium]|nr:hypothetical protein [Anaerolineales bacterium]
MRVERQRLVELARREVETRVEKNGLLAAYLIGSVVSGEPVLGGSADIDLVLIHENPPTPEREIVPLSEDVHFDIAHHGRARYALPRQLRVDPWLGPAVYAPLSLFDRDHLFEWAQAGARGQYPRADFARQRASSLLDSARHLRDSLATTSYWPSTYVGAVLTGANAIASLAAPPACGRRAMLLLEARLAQAGHSEIYSAVLELIGAAGLQSRTAPDHVGAWARAYDVCARITGEPLLSRHRRAYHLKGFQALLEEGAPQALLPGLLQTWDRVMGTLETFELAANHRDDWQAALSALGLSADSTAARTAALEDYLDHIEITLEAWGREHGA